MGYDCNGNLRSDGVRTFVYDPESRLVSGTLGATTLTLSYDPDGRLRQTSTGNASTQFLYAGDSLVAEYDGSGTLVSRYVPGPGVDETVVWYNSSGARQWLYADNQGSAIARSNANASGAGEIYAYGPYGEPSGWSGSRIRYTGQIMLPELQLYHYKARVYDPGMGRFLQTDPIGYKDDLDLYAYVGNDPVNRLDPTGLATVSYDDKAKTITVTQTFTYQNDASKPNPMTAQDIAAGSGTLGKVGDYTANLVLVEGNDSDAVHIKVNPNLNDSDPNDGSKRSHTDKIGGRNMEISPTANINTIRHEVAHVTGAGDQYVGGVDVHGQTITSGPLTNTQQIRMNSVAYSENQQTVDEIMSAPTNQHETCSAVIGDCY